MNFKKFNTSTLMVLSLLLAGVGCNGQSGEADSTPVDVSVEAEKVVSLDGIGWGIAFLPEGDMLVTEKSGKLYRVNGGEVVAEITDGIPSDLQVNGQGGFLDITLHPDYESNGWIYFSYASSAGGGEGSNTAIMRAKLENDALVDSEVLYKAEPNSTRGQHYGSRIVFDNDGYMFFSIGDRGNRDVLPQDITMDGGKVYRLNDDGSVPSDNPFVGEEGIDAVYSYGHRNPQGMDMNPNTGQIWANEHGPRGGDEVNIVEAGNNYGWPVISYGINYNGTEFAEDTARAGMEQPILYWDPSIAPAGMAFVNSDKYPGWEGDLLVASLKFSYIAHLDVEGNDILGETKLVEGVGRIRDVVQGPDGYIYLTAEGDGVYRLVPTVTEATE
ncbi:PQQ-dependent sugar dehydrogenase [Gracilimonas amylolytica]|uniref:PQQ-dependent sugar dehydrogenase n=1 Tax=Gracilimonas amylolytica TaxID=1749045 RepID=UPI001E5FB777|nr:PQQ-dependent sugar dehydrogenase [Gracilimonas amylolytica]